MTPERISRDTVTISVHASKGRRGATKSFAGSLLKTATKSLVELEALACRKAIQLIPPSGLPAFAMNTGLPNVKLLKHEDLYQKGPQIMPYRK